MANRTSYVNKLALFLKPELFSQTKDNHDKSKGGWGKVDSDQKRFKRMLLDFMQGLEGIGLRIVDPSKLITEETIEEFDRVKPFFPSLGAHGNFRRQYYMRTRYNDKAK